MGWLRQIVLFIYVDGVLQKKYISDGTRKTLDIKFSVEKTIGNSPNESTVVLTNLSSKTKEALLLLTNKQKITVRLYAGYEDEGLSLIATGDLVKLFPERQGSSDIFTLTFLDGFSAYTNSHLETQFKSGTSLNSVVLTLAKSFEKDGVQVDPTKIDLDGTIGKRGYSTQGRTATILDYLANSYRFTWSIQNGVFQAYMDDRKKQNSKADFVISVKNRNLLKATPEIGEAYMQQIGMKIEAVLNSKCKPGDVVQLESNVYPWYNGNYEIYNLTLEGSAKDVDWKMIIDSKNINDGLWNSQK